MQATSRIVLASMAMLWAQSTSADAISGLVDFNTPTDLNRFNLAANSLVPDYFAAGGVGDSGSIGLSYDFNSACTLVYHERSFSMSAPTDTLALSIMFRYNPNASLPGGITSGNDKVAVHLFAEPIPDNQYSTGFAVSYYEAPLASGEIVRSINVGSYVNSGGHYHDFPIDPLVDGNWYRLAATFSLADAAQHNHVDIALEDFGTTGENLVDIEFQHSYTTNDELDLFVDAEAWAGFSTMLYDGAGADRADNFAFLVVPEPATWSLLAVAMACLALRMKAGPRGRTMQG